MAEWISVTDKRPTKRGQYLVYLPDQVAMGMHFPAEVSTREWNGRRFIGSLRASHWMPLPDPPEVRS